MNKWGIKISLAFSAGSLGGLINSFTVWIFGILVITGAFNVKIAPKLTAIWLYPRVVWGRLWGLLFLLPFMRTRHMIRGLHLSFGPTLAQLFVVFPFKAHKGLIGHQLGSLTPVFVIIFNGIWGIVTSMWLNFVESKKHIDIGVTP